MKITILGAAGDVGSRVTKEAIERGHVVTAVTRSAPSDRIDERAKVTIADIKTSKDVAKVSEGADLLVCALRPREGAEAELPSLTATVLDGAARAGVRIIIVGGAGSLRVPNSPHTVLTKPGFLPENVVPIARASSAQFELTAANKTADWTYLCPPGLLQPGKRTGHYTVGSGTLLVNSEGQSQISMEDLAVALLDEAETPAHSRRRFTVAEKKLA